MPTKRITVSIPDGALDEIDRLAAEAGETRTAYLIRRATEPESVDLRELGRLRRLVRNSAVHAQVLADLLAGRG